MDYQGPQNHKRIGRDQAERNPRCGTLPDTSAADVSGSLSELQAVTPDQFESLLHDLFEVNAYWELETERATPEQTAAGTWQVTLSLSIRGRVRPHSDNFARKQREPGGLIFNADSGTRLS